jgi:hypothetical protein
MSEYAIRRRPPAPVTVLGILHLVGGGLGLLSGICGGLYQLASSASGGSPFGLAAAQQGAAGVVMKAIENVPGQKAVTAVQLVVDLALSVMLVVAGIGLLRMRPWARSLSLVYAPLSILFHIFSLVWALGFVMPVVQEVVAAELAKNPPPQDAAALMGARIGMIAGLLGQVTVIYPIVVLCILLSPSVAAAFRGEAVARKEAEEFADEGWRPMRPPGDRGDITRGPDDRNPDTD